MFRLGAAAVEPALKEMMKNPNLRGVRHALAHTDPLRGVYNPPICDANTAYESQFREAFGLLEQHGLSYDCWLYHDNIGALRDLANAFPGTTIIMDHVGCLP